jgi:hypothetical protein
LEEIIIGRALPGFAMLLFIAILFPCSAIVQAEEIGVTLQSDPRDPALPDDEITRTSCTYQGKVYHYDLYIPTGYAASGDYRYPVMFIASTGGNATMGNAEGWIRARRWLAVMLVEAKNGPPEPNNENFLCAHDDVLQRVQVDENMKFATGVSGAARMSARFVTFRPGFRGLILQAAGLCSSYVDDACLSITGYIANKADLYTFATFGDTDFNLWELDYLEDNLPAERLNYEVFQGGHGPAPVEVVNRGLRWMAAHILEQAFLPLVRR